jgi:hypothetical protein
MQVSLLSREQRAYEHRDRHIGDDIDVTMCVFSIENLKRASDSCRCGL